MMAVGLVSKVLSTPLPVAKAMPLAELFMWAKVAAGMDGRTFP
ncbi:hypothetical protein RPD76_07550 [Methylomonas sp. MV1]|nr:hypothetical protein [Methylomonas sp. MV1]MDT4329760.1 hypothetical protein [Methylomonas sp. MV1]